MKQVKTADNGRYIVNAGKPTNMFECVHQAGMAAAYADHQAFWRFDPQG